MKFNSLLFVTMIFFLFSCNEKIVSKKFPNVALTPPMGWNSWNCFRSDISEEKIKSIADAMVSSGMKDAGYEYVIIDDGWMTDKRDKDGHITVDSTKFPNGINVVADYIHSLGLKFGIYSAPGCYTCQQLMGSLGHEQTDANDYAKWGVDYLKYDWCRYPKTREEARVTSEAECRAAFELMRDCLYNTGRPIVYSVHDMCTNMMEYEALPWVKDVAHMHRTSNDIKDNWDRMLWVLETTVELADYAGPGYWNDLDMLEVGNTAREHTWGNIDTVKMKLHEYQTHFSMWCMAASPLMAGNDIRTMKPEIRDILTFKDMIAINQDPLGKQAKKVRDYGDFELWVKELSGNRRAVALLNRFRRHTPMKFNWDEIGMSGKLKIRDVLGKKDLGVFENSFFAEEVKSHNALILLIEKE